VEWTPEQLQHHLCEPAHRHQRRHAGVRYPEVGGRARSERSSPLRSVRAGAGSGPLRAV